MGIPNGLLNSVLNLDDKDFERVALEVFEFQARENKVYQEYIKCLGIDVETVKSLVEIPFIPIALFKSKKIVTGSWPSKAVFTSSGTGASGASKHHIRSLKHYEDVSLRIFKKFYGSPEDYHIMALLPSYLDRSGSSLVHMVSHLIEESGSAHSGFYLRNYQQLTDQLRALSDTSDRKIMLWGVSFALMDLAERGPLDLSEAVIIETGGMKGQRKEMIREELHQILLRAFGGTEIQSEYGMAELTSQAYTVSGRFHPPSWMKVMVRDINDPFHQLSPGKVGGLNLVDLANIDSCAFIETQDLGEVDESGTFQVLGRIDNSDARGCNLLVISDV